MRAWLLHALASLLCALTSAEPVPLGAVYANAYGELPQDLLSAGISNLGRTFRTKNLLARLRGGQPVTVLMLGGSVTHRMGGCTDAVIATCLNNLPCCGLRDTHDADDAGHGRPERGAGWGRLFVDWLQDTYPTANITLYNAGASALGNTPEPYLSCLFNMLPARFHLVTLDFHVNDGYNRIEVPEPALEHLIRRLLRHEGHPVVMLTPAFDWCIPPPWHVPTPRAPGWPSHWPGVCKPRPDMPSYALSLYTPFAGVGSTWEDAQHKLGVYYQLPEVSERNALFTWLASNATAVNATWNLGAKGMPGDLGDGVHPYPPLQHVWADLLIHWFRVVTLLHDSFEDGQTVNRGLPAMVQRVSHQTYACFSAFFGGLRNLSGVTLSGDFEWSTYQPPGRDPKWGYVGHSLGAFVQVVLNTTLLANHEGHASRKPFIGIELLHTAEHGAGVASVACVAGCQCATTEVNTTAPEYSLPQTTTVAVTQSQTCAVEVNITQQGRVVFTGITLGESYDGTLPARAPVAGLE